MKTKNNTPGTSTPELIVAIDRLELAQQLNSPQSFYRYWFEQLTAPENRDITSIEVFNKVNNLYQDIFKVDGGRFKSYKDFQNTMAQFRKEPV